MRLIPLLLLAIACSDCPPCPCEEEVEAAPDAAPPVDAPADAPVDGKEGKGKAPK